MSGQFSPNPIAEAQAYPVDSSAPTVIPAFNMAFDDGGAREVLSGYNWPAGLQESFIKNLGKVPIRYFVCDDSGSMASSDGHKLVVGSNKAKSLVKCSRWSELTEALRFHAAVAKQALAPSEFRMLNGAPPLMIGTHDPDEVRRYDQLISTFDNSPAGGTPLCFHINQIINQIRAMEGQLRANGQLACIIIFTDGESSDGDIAHAMRPLKSLPVNVVIRLCTDDERIVNYWNSIDKELELNMDVLDDLCGEAEEVHKLNPWLTYGEPLHRLREFGMHLKEVDLIDESHLTLEQIRLFCSVLFGGAASTYPHPEADYPGFIDRVRAENTKLGTTWNPHDQGNKQWINVAKLAHLKPKKKGGCTIS